MLSNRNLPLKIQLTSVKGNNIFLAGLQEKEYSCTLLYKEVFHPISKINWQYLLTYILDTGIDLRIPIPEIYS